MDSRKTRQRAKNVRCETTRQHLNPRLSYTAAVELPLSSGSRIFGSAMVSPDSRTPYSDATRTRAEVTSSSERRGHIRRPMNAFMVWSQIERRQVLRLQPELHNADISRRLGARWHQLSTAERRPFVEEAAQLRRLHSIEFPEYKYRPRKKTTPHALKQLRSQRPSLPHPKHPVVMERINARRSKSSSNQLLPISPASPSPMECPRRGYCLRPSKKKSTEEDLEEEEEEYSAAGVNLGVKALMGRCQTLTPAPVGRSRRLTRGLQQQRPLSVTICSRASDGVAAPPNHNLPPTPDSIGFYADNTFRSIVNDDEEEEEEGDEEDEEEEESNPPPSARTRSVATPRLHEVSFRGFYFSPQSGTEVLSPMADDTRHCKATGTDSNPAHLLWNDSQRKWRLASTAPHTSDENRGGSTYSIDLSSSLEPCADYLTPEVAAMVKEDWLQTNLANFEEIGFYG